MKTVRLIVFPGAFNWPVWVARSKGWLAAEGIALDGGPMVWSSTSPSVVESSHHWLSGWRSRLLTTAIQRLGRIVPVRN